MFWRSELVSGRAVTSMYSSLEEACSSFTAAYEYSARFVKVRFEQLLLRGCSWVSTVPPELDRVLVLAPGNVVGHPLPASLHVAHELDHVLMWIAA
jgi:hypothetical protein